MVSLKDSKKTILISLFGHITMFGLFSLSFGHIIPKANCANILFLGPILRSADLNSQSLATRAEYARASRPLALDKINGEYLLFSPQYTKPQAPFLPDAGKDIFTPKAETMFYVPAKKESVIMFYPALPYHFLLYFKDRQTVHIELMFGVIPTGNANSIAVKRKISSGNLEVDLLVMRYIRHYLFIQQEGFSHNIWQTVKIDLLPKND